MDLAIYISELLGRRGELKVPGVGYFAQIRVNGYYNDQERIFYPPGKKVNFDPRITDDDDSLAEYIAVKKKISLLSAKYFVDKYLKGLRQEVQTQQVELADLGYLYTEDSKIAFKPGSTLTATVPEFYGFSPLKAYKIINGPVIVAEPVIEDTQPIIIPAVTSYTETPVVTEEVFAERQVSRPQVFSPHDQDQQHLQDIEHEIRKPSMLVVILFAVTILGLILFGFYLYNPDLFGNKPQTNMVVKPINEPKPVTSKDTVKKAPPIVPQTVAVAQDTLGRLHYEIMGGAFGTMPEVNVAIKNYKSLGLKAKLLKHAAGRRYKITLGTYFSQDEAVKVQDSILKVTKISKESLYIQPINPQK